MQTHISLASLNQKTTLKFRFLPTFSRRLQQGFQAQMFICPLLGVLCSLLVAPAISFSQDGKNQKTSVEQEAFAGTGVGTKSDGSAALQGRRQKMALGNPFGVEVVGEKVWLTTVDDQCVWQTTTRGQKITRVAGNGTKGYSGDGGPALEAAFNWPHEVRVDAQGNLFIADTRNHVVRRVDGASGIVTTIAGDGKNGFAGEGKTGNAVQFDQPHSVVLDGDGGLLVADTKNHRLRRIDLNTLIVTTVAGTGERKLPTDGASAKGSPLFGPRSLAVDEKSVWVALREGNSIWRIDREAWTIHLIAGTGKKGYSGDGGSPKQATFSGPKGIAIDGDGNLLIVDTENHAIRKVDFSSNKISTVLGGTAANQTTVLKRPHGIASVAPGDGEAAFLVGDSENHRVVQGDVGK